MKRLLLVAALLLTGCGTGNANIVSQALAPDTTPDSAVVQGSVNFWIVQGHGNAESERMQLTGGDYEVTWWASCDSMPNVFSFMDDKTQQVIGPFGGTAGVSRANGIERGDFYFSALAGPCDWKVMIERVV